MAKGAEPGEPPALGLVRVYRELLVGSSARMDNMVGAAKSTFTFNAKLRNFTAGNQVYALDAQAPTGRMIALETR